MKIIDVKPKMAELTKKRLGTWTGKLYTSHDLYYKNQLYYEGKDFDDYPAMAKVEDRQPESMVIKDQIPKIGYIGEF